MKIDAFLGRFGDLAQKTFGLALGLVWELAETTLGMILNDSGAYPMLDPE